MWILMNKSTACYKQNYKQFQVEKKKYAFGLHTNPFSEIHYCLKRLKKFAKYGERFEHTLVDRDLKISVLISHIQI